MGNLEHQFDIKRSKNAKDGGVKLTKEFKRALVIQKVVQTVLILALMGIAALSAYVAYFGPIKTPNGYVKIERKTVLLGDKVIASGNKDSIQARFKEAMMVEPTLIEGNIIAGPSGVFYGESGDITVVSVNNEGEVKSNIILEGDDKDKTKLDGEYIVRCSIDYCKKGKDYIVPASKMKGVILKENTQK